MIMVMIMKDIKGKSYKQLIDILFKHSDTFAFVESTQWMEFESDRLAFVDQLISDIKVHLIERKVQTKWETTRHTDGNKAYVYYFRNNNATKLFLKEYSQSLFGWIGPEMPEDLMFYRKDQCILAACSHEGYFGIEDEVWREFLSK